MSLRHGVRALANRPAFSAAALLTLALGIGGSTAVFSVLDAALLRPLPVPEADRVVLVQQSRPGGTANTSFSYPAFREISQAGGSALDLAAHAAERVIFRLGDRVERIDIELVTFGYFDVLGVRPAAGRFFVPDEDRAAGSGPVCVLGHQVWRDRFGADLAVIGRTATLNGRPFTVVGIAPAGFTGLTRGVRAGVWAPMSMYPAVRYGDAARVLGRIRPSDIFDEPDWHWLRIVGRLKPNVTLAAAQGTLAASTASLASLNQTRRAGVPVSVAPFGSGFGGRVEPLAQPLVAMTAAVGLLLLLACANVANLLLVREATRRRELAVRLALGATRAHVAAGLLREHGLLVAAGGALGLLVAHGLVALLPRIETGGVSPLDLGASLDARVLGVALLVTLATVLLSGLVPALGASRTSVAPALRQGPAAPARAGHAFGLRQLLVAAQVAISLVLLLGSGALVRSLLNLQRVPLGFETDTTLAASVNLTGHISSVQEGVAFGRHLLERLGAVPGVRAVSLAHSVPIDSRNSSMGGLRPEGMTSLPPRGVQVFLNVVWPGYFAALGIPTVRGRAFTDVDAPGDRGGVVINETAARTFWPGQDPIGRRFYSIPIPGIERLPLEVIGVVADSRFASLEKPIEPLLYFHAVHPILGQVAAEQGVVVRTVGDPVRLLPALQEAARSVDRNLSLFEADRLGERVARVSSVPRATALVIGFFGALALLVAAVGLYGVLAQIVLERTREVGVRMALGASRGQVVLMVARSASAMLAAGLVAGGVAAAGLGRTISSLLFDVTPADPLVVGIATVTLTAVAALAALAPARRAAAVDPAVTLRAE